MVLLCWYCIVVCCFKIELLQFIITIIELHVGSFTIYTSYKVIHLPFLDPSDVLKASVSLSFATTTISLLWVASQSVHETTLYQHLYCCCKLSEYWPSNSSSIIKWLLIWKEDLLVIMNFLTSISAHVLATLSWCYWWALFIAIKNNATCSILSTYITDILLGYIFFFGHLTLWIRAPPSKTCVTWTLCSHGYTLFVAAFANCNFRVLCIVLSLNV